VKEAKMGTNDPSILSTTKSPTPRANPTRGYHDSLATIVFEAGTAQEKQLEVATEIQKDLAESNMWSYAPKNVAPNTWTINYGFDSGD
jgi:hypothetical protein